MLNRKSPKTRSRRHSKSFILEPILTPSSIVDTGLDDGLDVPDEGFSLPAEPLMNEGEGMTEGETGFPDDPGLPDGDTEIPGVESGDVSAGDPGSEFEEIPYFPDDALIPQTANIEFTSGVFTVGESGEVEIDYLFDGGKYDRGELAIFSLEGMESEPGTREFIQEAAQRALSNSEQGYVVISDATDGARFSNTAGKDFNGGQYQGVQTFQMKAGDRFGFMLVPNQSIQTAAEGRAWGTVFSMATDNPDDYFQFGQIADVTGDGNTFTLEDISLAGGRSDRDYNDIIFQVRGATGDVPLMDDLVAEGQDWRTDEMGIKIIEYVDQVMEQLAIENRGRQVFVGIIDTGFAANNPDLNYDNIHLGSDWVDGDTNPLLEGDAGNQHGTHIAGIIGATQNNDLGIDGINDDAPLWFGRAIGSGRWAESLMEFVDAAAESGQPNAVVNLSLDLTQIDANGEVTTRYEFTPQERQAIEYARQNGVLLVVSAGNDGGVMSVLGQASQEFDNIITVGAADGTERADYSSYGHGLDLLAEGGTAENPLTSLVNDGIGTMAGTSVATAQVTGAVSKVWAMNPELSYRQVITILKETATDLAAPGWDAETGAGLLNLAAAIQVARETQGEVYDPEDFATPITWEGLGKVTAQERAVNTKSIEPVGRRKYEGYLYSGNKVDEIEFRADWLSRTLEFALDNQDATISLWNGSRHIVTAGPHHENPSIDYAKVTLQPYSLYTIKIEQNGSRTVGDYDVVLNFNEQDPKRGFTGSDIEVSKKPSSNSTGSGGSQSFSAGGKYSGDNSRDNAWDLGNVTDTTVTDWIGDGDIRDYYKFTLDQRSEVDIRVDNVTDGVDLRMYYSDNRVGPQSVNPGTADEHINTTLPAGTYYVKVSRDDAGDSTHYRLRIKTGSGNSSGGSSGSGSSGGSGSSNSGQSGSNSGIPVGFDGASSHGTYQAAYGRANGALGSPKDNVHPVGAGYMQHFLGGSEGRGAIMKSNLNNNAYWVAGDFWSAFSAVGGAAGIMSYPTSDRYAVSGGQKQDFLGGVILKSSAGTFPVFGAMLGQYQKEGGERGRLGFPVSGEISQGNGVIKQNFENGYILWNGKKATTYITQKTAPIAPRPTPTPNLLTSGNWGTLYGRHTSQIYTGSQNRAGLFDFKIGSALGGSQRLVQFALVDQGGKNIPLSAAEIDILDSRGRPVNLSQVWNPVAGSVPGKTTLPAGDYKVRVKPKQNLNYRVVMNLDTVGTVNLGTLKDIKSSGDYTIPQYVGSGDQIDRYTFRVERDTLTHLALKPPAGDTGANMYYAHMKLLNSSGRDVMLENPRKSKSENYATAWLKAGETYMMEVSREVNQGTNYNLVINPDYSQKPLRQQAEAKAIAGINGVRKLYQSELGQPTGNIFIDQTTRNGDRVEASQYFENGHIVWDGSTATVFLDETDAEDAVIDESKEWKTEVYTWTPTSNGKPPRFHHELQDRVNLNLIGTISLGSNERVVSGEVRNGLEIKSTTGGLIDQTGVRQNLPSDKFLMKSYTKAKFSKGVEYEFMARGDDGYQIWAKHIESGEWEPVTPRDEWQDNHGAESYKFVPKKTGEYYVVNYYYEDEGDAGFGMNWKSPRFDELRAKERLTTQEIKEFRSLIEQQVTDPQQKGDLYEELQVKVEYRSQRDNKATYADGTLVENEGGEMCSLTSLAMALSYLGITVDDYAKVEELALNSDTQFEDALNQIREEKGLGLYTMRGWIQTEISNFFGSVETDLYDNNLGVKDQLWYETVVRPKLRDGQSVIISTKNHIVRLQSITDGGVIVDDPFAKSKLNMEFRNNIQWLQYNLKGEYSTVGENTEWSWDQFKNYDMEWIVSLKKTE